MKKTKKINKTEKKLKNKYILNIKILLVKSKKVKK